MLRIDLGVEPYVDGVALQQATLQLRKELLQLDVMDVERPTKGAAPPGTRGMEATLLGTLVVTAGGNVLNAVMGIVANWAERWRKRGIEYVVVRLGDDEIVVTDPLAEDQRRLIEAFLARHAGDSR